MSNLPPFTLPGSTPEPTGPEATEPVAPPVDESNPVVDSEEAVFAAAVEAALGRRVDSGSDPSATGIPAPEAGEGGVGGEPVEGLAPADSATDDGTNPLIPTGGPITEGVDDGSGSTSTPTTPDPTADLIDLGDGRVERRVKNGRNLSRNSVRGNPDERSDLRQVGRVVGNLAGHDDLDGLAAHKGFAVPQVTLAFRAVAGAAKLRVVAEHIVQPALVVAVLVQHAKVETRINARHFLAKRVNGRGASLPRDARQLLLLQLRRNLLGWHPSANLRLKFIEELLGQARDKLAVSECDHGHR